MSFVDPVSIQNPTTGLVAPFGWGDAVNGDLNYLRGAKAGCYMTSTVGSAAGFMPWGTEFYDVNGCHSTVTNTDRITVPSGWAGLWFVGCDLAMTSDIFTVAIAVSLSGGGPFNIGQASTNVSGAAESMVSVSTIYPVAVGDYFTVFVTGGSTRSTGQTSRYYAHWLAA
jgi:hypothetical protein